MKEKAILLVVKLLFARFPAFARLQLLLGQIKHFREISRNETRVRFQLPAAEIFTKDL